MRSSIHLLVILRRYRGLLNSAIFDAERELPAELRKPYGIALFGDQPTKVPELGELYELLNIFDYDIEAIEKAMGTNGEG